ncbi:hypothetical protein BHM03_00049123 [Ensete ventricosum]|nr:hypothetical protein BHM03_00049123 [Ensete ventricosum]
MAVGDPSSAAMPFSQAPSVCSVVSNSSFVPTPAGSIDIVLSKPSFQSFSRSLDYVAIEGISLSHENVVAPMVFIIVALSIINISGLLPNHTRGAFPPSKDQPKQWTRGAKEGMQRALLHRRKYSSLCVSNRGRFPPGRGGVGFRNDWRGRGSYGGRGYSRGGDFNTRPDFGGRGSGRGASLNRGSDVGYHWG